VAPREETGDKMTAWVGAFLLLLLSDCFYRSRAIEESPVGKPFIESADPPTRRQLSVDDVTSLLVTEAHTEYGTHRQLKEVSDELWTAAIDYEWSRARKLENTAQKNSGALRRRTEASGTFPYLVCDIQPGKAGELCRATVEEHFGSDLLVSYI